MLCDRVKLQKILMNIFPVLPHQEISIVQKNYLNLYQY